MAEPKKNEFLVTGERNIHRLFERIAASKRSASVRFNDSNKTCNTLIFAVDTERNTCLLDELAPADGTHRLLNGESASVECVLDGVTTWFGAGKILRTGKVGGKAAMEMQLPQRAWYKQRREAFRAQAFGGMNLSAMLVGRNRDTNLRAKLEDLSVTGCRISLPSSVSPTVETGELFYRCQIAQDGRTVANTAAEVRHVEGGNSGETYVGLHFTEVSPQQESVLSQLVMKLELALKHERVMA